MVAVNKYILKVDSFEINNFIDNSNKVKVVSEVHLQQLPTFQE